MKKTGGTCFVAFALGVALSSASSAAFAEPAPPVVVDGGPAFFDRNPFASPFLYMRDPSIPAPGQVAVTLGVGNVTRSGEERPAGAGPIVPTLGAEIGIVGRLSLFTDVGLESAPGVEASPLTADAGLHLIVSDPDARDLRLAVEASIGRELGASVTRVAATVAWRRDLVLVAASLVLSHSFQPGADALDLGGTFAATLALPHGFRVGGELVVSDLEELVDPEDEGGASAFAGPTLGWARGTAFEIVGGPAFGLGPGTAGLLALGLIPLGMRRRRR